MNFLTQVVGLVKESADIYVSKYAEHLAYTCPCDTAGILLLAGDIRYADENFPASNACNAP